MPANLDLATDLDPFHSVFTLPGRKGSARETKLRGKTEWTRSLRSPRPAAECGEQALGVQLRLSMCARAVTGKSVLVGDAVHMQLIAGRSRRTQIPRVQYRQQSQRRGSIS